MKQEQPHERIHEGEEKRGDRKPFALAGLVNLQIKQSRTLNIKSEVCSFCSLTYCILFPDVLQLRHTVAWTSSTIPAAENSILHCWCVSVSPRSYWSDILMFPLRFHKGKEQASPVQSSPRFSPEHRDSSVHGPRRLQLSLIYSWVKRFLLRCPGKATSQRSQYGVATRTQQPAGEPASIHVSITGSILKRGHSKGAYVIWLGLAGLRIYRKSSSLECRYLRVIVITPFPLFNRREQGELTSALFYLNVALLQVSPDAGELQVPHLWLKRPLVLLMLKATNS